MRVVSLVPSLTEAIALGAPGTLAGATDYCTHPPDLDVPRVGGSKYPSVEKILALRPDLVVANMEENREPDVAALRAAGVAVHLTYPRSVAGALAELGTLFARLDRPAPAWLDDARAAWAAPVADRGTVAVPVWRRPWVVIGSDTFAGDVLARLGYRNVYAGAADRYPRPTLDELRATRPDLVALPDEPYEFTATDGPDAFPGQPCALVSGRHLTWYGPSLVEARSVLTGQLGRIISA